MRHSFLLVLAAAALTVAGCSIDENSNPTPRCTTDAECVGDRVCYMGYCILGGSVDGGMDAGFDGEVPDTGRDTAGCVPMGEEECNGLDDDCDGETDNLPRNDETDCPNGELGVCALAHFVCPDDGGAIPVCRRDTEPGAETCNELDDDCDGDVDEDSSQRCYPDGTAGCSLVAGRYICTGGCAAGVQLCVDGAYGDCVEASMPGDETCTTAGQVAGDENCDGMIDEGCPSCTDGADCYPGDIRLAGLGTCTIGDLDCDTHTCTGFGMPSEETCGNAMADNDCNGETDDVPGVGVTCFDDTMMGICGMGVTSCNEEDVIECDPPEMSAMESCDGFDDDCDGTVDDGFDLATNEEHCGACNAACATGLFCWASMCRNGGSDPDFCGATDGDDGEACADGVECCGGACNDYQTDELNCGACGNVCDGGDMCCGGECVDVDYNEDFCGSCETSCDATNPQCCAGDCSPADTCNFTPEICESMDMTLCDGRCVDTLTDESFCAPAGTCGAGCSPGSLCCDGACVPNDAANCGTCGNDCDAGDLCCSGACVDSNNEHCGSCTTTCGSGLTCCGTMCSTRNTDTHCGACGNACADGQACSNGNCCADGLTWCGAAGCVNLQTSNSHCGSCGNRCLPVLVVPTHCEAGDCVL